MIGYGTNIVQNGLVLHLDAANPKSRLGTNLINNKSLDQFKPNQSVSITQNGSKIYATANQTTSTPGVWPIGNNSNWISVSANTQYTFQALTSIVSGSTAWLYVTGSITGNIVWQGTALSTNHQWIENTFNTGSNTAIKVGILWQAPTIGSTIMIEDVGLYNTNMWYNLSSNNNHGSLINGPTYNNADRGSIIFDGVDDYVLVGSSESLNFIYEETTIAWYFPTNLDSGRRSRIGNRHNGFLTLSGNSFGYEGFNSDSNWGNNIYTGATVELNKWQQLAFTFKGQNNVSLYKNGVYVTGKSITTNQTNIGGNFVIGTETLGGWGDPAWYSGKVSVVFNYNRTLSSAEIAQNFEATRGRYNI